MKIQEWVCVGRINNMDVKEANQLSPLNLAWIGDAVFELKVRSFLLSKTQVSRLNVKAKKYVNASSQSLMYNALEPILSEEELSVMKRGRNAKSYTKAKNKSVSEYRHATGVEALFGYLYITGRDKRVEELFEICKEVVYDKEKQ